MNFNYHFSKYPTDKAYPHSYGEVYDKYFPDDESRLQVTDVLEIGIANGGSLQAFSEYFPRSNILGVDINPDFQISDERIWSLCGDQSDPKFLQIVGEQFGPFDIIVDDGSHRPQDQLLSLLYLWEYLRPCGHYFIEDIITTIGITGFAPNNIVDLMRLLPGTVYDHTDRKQCKNDTIVVLQKG